MINARITFALNAFFLSLALVLATTMAFHAHAAAPKGKVNPTLKYDPTRQLKIDPSMLVQRKMTNFNPSTHGFHFANRFRNNFVSELDIHTGGLCGGMVYSAMDYYRAGKQIPDWKILPAEHTALRQHIYSRQVNSVESNIDKWAEVIFNPDGARNAEFFRWGMQRTNGGRVEELKRAIDAGNPAPLGLKSCGQENCIGDHQVLAIGYELGSAESNLKIFVYDPNHPGAMKTLVPRPSRQVYTYLEHEGTDDEQNWLTYFVDANYSPRTAPNVPRHVFPNDGKYHALEIEFMSGNDDLRGGNDQASIKVRGWDGFDKSWANINHSKRWIGNSIHGDRYLFGRGVAKDALRDIEITTNFGGGVGGDNWNLNHILIWGVGNGIRDVLYQEPTGDWKTRYDPKDDLRVKRFTGWERSHVITFNVAPPADAAAREAATREPSTLERNTNRPGAAYRTFWMTTRNYRLECQRTCELEAQCKSWTYNKDLGDNGACYLRNTLPRKNPDNCCTSGIKMKYIKEDLAR